MKSTTNLSIVTLPAEHFEVMHTPHSLLAQAHAEESAKYDTFKFTNGYAQATKVGLTVTRGASGKLHYVIKTKAITMSTFEDWKSETASYFSSKQKSELEENWGGGGLAGGFLAGAFGMIFAAGDANHYRNKNDSTVTATSKKQKGFARATSLLKQDHVRITGTLKAKGTSFIPTTVFAFVEISTVTLNDGTTFNVVSGSATAADENGDSSESTGEASDYNIVKI